MVPIGVYLIAGGMLAYFGYEFYRDYRKAKPKDKPKITTIYLSLVAASAIIFAGIQWAMGVW